MPMKTFAAIVAALALASACNEQARSTISLVEGDSFMGPADAKVTVVEYGSPTCPGCKAWHDQNWERMKSDYVRPGKIKFVFRELPVHGAIDAAIFSIARCAGQDEYFAVLDEAFARQDEIVRAAQTGGAVPAMVSLGRSFRLSEEQVKSCIDDPQNIQRIYEMQEEANARGVRFTPTFFINDQPVPDYSYAGMTAQIEAALTGAPAPQPAAPDAEAHEHAPGEAH